MPSWNLIEICLRSVKNKLLYIEVCRTGRLDKVRVPCNIEVIRKCRCSWPQKLEFVAGLDYKKEPELEQKRQQIQRALSQLEEDAMENITIQKKVGLPVAVVESAWSNYFRWYFIKYRHMWAFVGEREWYWG